LINWITSSGGFTEESLVIAEKYLKETPLMLDLFLEKYPDSFKEEDMLAITKAWTKLKEKNEELKSI
jgi:hypothetical protein